MPAMTTAKAAVLALATSSLATAAEHRAKHNHRRSPVSGYPSGSGFAPYGPENSTNLWPTSAAGSAVTPSASGPMTVTVVPVAASDASAVDAAGGSATGAAAPPSSAFTPVGYSVAQKGYVPGTSALANAQGTCPPGNTLTTTVTQRQTVYVTASGADDVAAAAASSSAVPSSPAAYSATAYSAAAPSGNEVSPEDATSAATPSSASTASLVGYQAKAVNNGRKGYQGGQWSQNWNHQSSSAAGVAPVAPASTAETTAAAQSSAATSVAAISAPTSAVSYASSPTSVAALSVVVSTSNTISYVPTTSAYVAPSAASSSAAAASPSTAASSPQGLAKRGCAYNDPTFCNDNFGSSQMNWAYNWDSKPVTIPGTQLDQTKYQYIPMLHMDTDYFTSGWATNVAASTSPYLMSINEPDNEGQANLNVSYGLEFYIKYMKDYKGTHQLGAPAVSSSDAGKTWIQQWVAGCNADANCHYDFVPYHYYEYSPTPDASGLINHTEFMYAAGGNKPLWLTEVSLGDLGATGTAQAAYLNQVKSFLDSSPMVERWSWFMASGNMLCDSAYPALASAYMS